MYSVGEPTANLPSYLGTGKNKIPRTLPSPIFSLPILDNIIHLEMDVGLCGWGVHPLVHPVMIQG